MSVVTIVDSVEVKERRRGTAQRPGRSGHPRSSRFPVPIHSGPDSKNAQQAPGTPARPPQIRFGIGRSDEVNHTIHEICDNHARDSKRSMDPSRMTCR